MSVKVQMVQALIPPELVAGLSKGAINTVLGDIAAGARAEWVRLGSEINSSFRNDYIRGIQPVQMMEGVAVVALVGAVPHMLEDGAPKTDLRDTLLGPNVPIVPVGERGKHQSKPKGKNEEGGPYFYRAIPLRHSTPGTTKQIGQPMGSPYAGHDAVVNSKKLGKTVYAAAKKLAPTTGMPYGGTSWGEKLNTSDFGIPLLKPHHKSDIYSGMYRMQKTYEAATQNYYMTFRTISTRPHHRDSWIRKPFPARHLAKQVAAYVQKIAPAAFQAYYQEQGIK
jgi:hypothetical protein